jgi:hypothetical protein
MTNGSTLIRRSVAQRHRPRLTRVAVATGGIPAPNGRCQDHSALVAQGGLEHPPCRRCVSSGIRFDSQSVVHGSAASACIPSSVLSSGSTRAPTETGLVQFYTGEVTQSGNASTAAFTHVRIGTVRTWAALPTNYSGFAPKASRRPSQSFTTNSRERQGVLASARVNSTPRLAYSAYSASASSTNR